MILKTLFDNTFTKLSNAFTSINQQQNQTEPTPPEYTNVPAEKIKDYLMVKRARDRFATQFNVDPAAFLPPNATTEDFRTETFSLEAQYRDFERITVILKNSEELAILKGTPFDKVATQNKLIATVFKKDQGADNLFIMKMDLDSELRTIKNAPERYLAEKKTYQKLRWDHEGTPFKFDRESVQAEIDHIIKEKGAIALVKEVERLETENQKYFDSIPLETPATEPDSVIYKSQGTIEEHLNTFIAERTHVASQKPSSPYFEQYVHSGAPPVGDPTKPAIVDACYKHYDRHLISISFPDFVPEERGDPSKDFGTKEQTGFTAMRSADNLKRILQHFGIIEYSTGKSGHHRPTRTRYIEFDVNEEDYESGRAIIDTLVRSEKTNPTALKKEIEERLKKMDTPAPESTKELKADITLPGNNAL